MTASAQRTYEIRCPVYGFIELNDWEWEVISQAAFQRLRRIRQLAWTDYVFPGAMHTRFEHSLGVMHMASMLYDGIVARSKEMLQAEFGYDDKGLGRHRQLIRLGALLHDLGHSPFSHAAEDLFPFRDEANKDRYRHEDYSAAIVRHKFSDVIKNHPLNVNCGFTADDVANLLEGKHEAAQALFWRDLIDGQIDADRMDYLLRDSLHCGVSYGRYDWQRLVHTVVAVPPTKEASARIGVSEGGWHAAEGLVVARYFMFTQVYFHKTRVVYDHHLQHALAEMLPGGQFPAPVVRSLARYLRWDDWRVLGLLADGRGGEHGVRLATRDHFREIRHTSETPLPEDWRRLDRWREALGDLMTAEMSAEKSWYKVGIEDIPILAEPPSRSVDPLSEYSSIVGSIKPIQQVRLYARPENRDRARALLPDT